MTETGRPSHPAQADVTSPFLLLAKCDAKLFDDGVFEPFLRRMGLDPGAAPASTAASSLLADACLEVRFAEQRALVGRISDEMLKTAAHPDRPLRAAEVLACSPIGASSGSKVADSRELFKLMLLLIDLTQADQIFWSPAGLWSDAWAFRAAVAEMLASGMPPVLHLVAFARTGRGGAM